MSIFDTSCSSILFPMICDVYYATETQDSYGRIEKRWSLDSTRACNLYSMADLNQADKFGFDEKKFFNLETGVYGRTKTDVRKSEDGRFFPLSHILLTNIRVKTCDGYELLMYETNGGYDSSATIFEPRTVHPYMSPWGRIDFYQVKLDRSDSQELNDIASC
jgi:hypothetical protein